MIMVLIVPISKRKKEEFALAASESLTGFIHAYALMRGKKISDMYVKGLKKKSFAAACNREIIKKCEKLGLSLEEILEIGINTIKKLKKRGLM